MPPKFFITHSWKDIEFARRLFNDLTAQGPEGWMDDKTMQGGHRIAEEINRGLEWCDVYIPILSRAALESSWCWEEINAAIALANQRGRDGRPRIVSVIVEECNLPPSLVARLYFSFAGRYDNALEELLNKGFGILEIHKAPTDDKPPLGRNPFQPTQSSTQQLPIDSTEESPQVPQIISVAVTPELITGGEFVRLQVRVKSQAPVNWLNVSLDGPRGNLHGGGSTHNFREVSPGTWESEWNYDISKWAPSGIYTFSNISVKNEAELTSPVWQQISFKVVTPPTPQIVVPPAPVIQTPPRTKIGKDGKEMLLIPAGEFVVGSDQGERHEKPPHNVYLDTFYISRFPVTNAEYKKFVDATNRDVPFVNEGWAKPYNWDKQSRTHPKDKANHPVVLVTWRDAVAYTEWAGGRLPTEAEWEKAASWDEVKKGKRIYPWGKDFDASKCNTDESKIGGTTPVDKYPQGDSAYGVGDMAGNVWEWCADWYDENYYKDAPAQNLKGPDSGQYRVSRGGSWDPHRVDARCAARNWFNPDNRGYNLGFRVAESVPS